MAQSTMRCMNCGKEGIDARAKVCPTCGAAALVHRRDPLRFLIGGTIVLLLAIAGALLATFLYRSRPTEVASMGPRVNTPTVPTYEPSPPSASQTPAQVLTPLSTADLTPPKRYEVSCERDADGRLHIHPMHLGDRSWEREVVTAKGGRVFFTVPEENTASAWKMWEPDPKHPPKDQGDGVHFWVEPTKVEDGIQFYGSPPDSPMYHLSYEAYEVVNGKFTDNLRTVSLGVGWFAITNLPKDRVAKRLALWK